MDGWGHAILWNARYHDFLPVVSMRSIPFDPASISQALISETE